MTNQDIESVLDQVRPGLQMDGGDVELVGITEDNVVQVKLVGACGSCPYSLMTLQHGIESRLREAFPQITAVENV